MAYKSDNAVIGLGIFLIIISLAFLLYIYNQNGLSWDFADLYLNAKTYINPAFYHQNLPINLTQMVDFSNKFYPQTANYYITPQHIYLSLVREPMVSVILAFFIAILGSNAMPVYLAFLLIMLFASSLYISKNFDINPYILTALLFSPFVIQWTILFTSQEILSMCFALVALGLIIKKSPFAGAAIALVGLTKYPGLILLPMLLLLIDFKNIKGTWLRFAESLALFALVTAPWLLFNHFYFNNAFLSYFDSLHEAIINNPSGAVSGIANTVIALPQLLLYPIIIIAASLAIIYTHGRHRLSILRIKSKIFNDEKYKTATSFFLLSLIEILLVYNNVGSAQRFAYLAYASAAIIATLAFEASAIHIKAMENTVPIAMCAASAILLIILYLSNLNSGYQSWLGAGTNNATVLSAIQSLNNQGIASCVVVSNAWPLLNYHGIIAYESDVGCPQAVVFQYPIVIFKKIGLLSYCGYPIKSNAFPNNENFVTVAHNYTCQPTS